MARDCCVITLSLVDLRDMARIRLRSVCEGSEILTEPIEVSEVQDLASECSLTRGSSV